jgi:hypothetical protein
MMADPANQVGDRDFYLSPDAIGAIQDVLGAAWADKNASVDGFIGKFEAAISTQ